MPELIRAERTDLFTGRVLLPGEVRGVAIRHCVAKGGRPLALEEEPGKVHVRVFMSGSGKLTIGSRGYTVSEIAVAIAARNAPAAMEPGTDFLEFLDIVLDLEQADEKELLEHIDRLPYFRPYSECEIYGEEIKSAKTVSRTLVPPDVLPRFSMGSVQTTGPDIVGAHQHVMLEQFFFGLHGNSCHVQADDQEMYFGEDMLLHIPLGSLHGVRVESGHTLHYLWLDFFRRQEDMSYISQVHLPVAD
jgi:mannose-6-phosphate isomerase-like protein (cupin superfamily)